MSNLILKRRLFDEVLLEPAKDFEKLCIVSGFASPSMVTHHLSAVKEKYKPDGISINLIVGMVYAERISKTHHLNFKKLAEEQEGFKCSYNIKEPAIHSKIYIWLKNEEPQRAFVTSANYSIQAFIKNQDEIATECDPKEAFDYYNSVVSSSIYCTHNGAEDFISVDNIHRVSGENQVTEEKNSYNKVELPLYCVRNNKIHSRSGLNWGQRPGRDKNQAYIPVPATIAKTDFFPPPKVQFCVLTDDGIPLICVRAQDSAKAIHTTYNNSELGLYFRKKLGLQSGEFVKLDDLDRYGNRHVIFHKLNEDEYYMEFTRGQE